MRKAFVSLPYALLMLVCVSCASHTANPSISGLVGTWESGGPAALGFSGTTWHSFHPDGTLATNINVVDDKGCRQMVHLVGGYSATSEVLSIKWRTGTREIVQCRDGSKNEPERALGE